MMQDLILADPLEMNTVNQCLRQCNRGYIAVSSQWGDCLFEAILCSLATPVKKKYMYTAYHLRQQACMYMILNYEKMLHFEPIRLTLIGQSTSLYQFIKKHIEPDFWGDSSMLHVIQDMWNINLSLINTWQRHDPITHYGKHTHINQSKVVIIYNGHNHFTGTGKLLYIKLA